VDALGDENTKKISIDNLKKIHLRLLQLEGRAPTTTPTGIPLEKYESPQETAPMWNPEDDVVLEQPEEKKAKKRKRESDAGGDGDGKKDKKKARRHSKA